MKIYTKQKHIMGVEWLCMVYWRYLLISQKGFSYAFFIVLLPSWIGMSSKHRVLWFYIHYLCYFFCVEIDLLIFIAQTVPTYFFSDSFLETIGTTVFIATLLFFYLVNVYPYDGLCYLWTVDAKVSQHLDYHDHCVNVHKLWMFYAINFTEKG